MKSEILRLYQQLPAYLSLLRRGQLFSVLAAHRQYVVQQRDRMAVFQEQCPEFSIVEEIIDRSSHGIQHADYQIAQFWYASRAIAALVPAEVYDIGSHRPWLIGVAAGLRLHTLDVRPPDLSVPTEVFHEGLAEKLPWQSDSVECLTSLCALEHFGLGSYGDPYDPHADLKAVAEMHRVLRPGGHLILTTLCTGRNKSFVRFNAGRVYSLGRLHEMLGALEVVDETFFSMPLQRFVSKSELQTQLVPHAWDIYFGTWKKPLQ